MQVSSFLNEEKRAKTKRTFDEQNAIATLKAEYFILVNLKCCF